MSSLVRRLQKAIDKRAGIETTDLPQAVRNITDDGYEVRHPTKGWRKVTTLRVYAPAVVASLRGEV